MVVIASPKTGRSVDGLYVSSAYTHAANTTEENANASVGEIPSYWVWNAAIERDFKLEDGVLTTSAGVSNLFDREYYFHSIDTSPWGRQPAPGPECAKTPAQTLAMISETGIAREAHETVYPG